MSKKLTRELIALKVKSDRLESIRKLNLWGSNLEDISIIAEMPSLEIVSLSVNKIRTLKPFANLQNLKELYLRKNLISNLNEIKHLTECDNLTKLWLKENPICENPNYREVIICVLPQVQNLDDIEITEEERDRAEKKLSGNYEEEEEDKDQNRIENEPREEEKFSPKKNNKNFSDKKKIDNGDYYDDEEEEKFENKNKIINKGMKNKINKYEEDDEFIQPKKLYEPKGNIRQNNNYYDNYDERPVGGAGKIAKNNNYRKAVTNDNIRYENKYEKKYENKYENYYQEKTQKEKKKGNSNVLNVVINLLKELSTNELQIVKREIDRINGY